MTHYQCNFQGECEEDIVGHSVRSQCQQDCQPVDNKDLLYIIHSYDDTDISSFAPSYRLRILKEIIGYRIVVPARDSIIIVNALWKHDYMALVCYPELNPYLLANLPHKLLLYAFNDKNKLFKNSELHLKLEELLHDQEEKEYDEQIKLEGEGEDFPSYDENYGSLCYRNYLWYMYNLMDNQDRIAVRTEIDKHDTKLPSPLLSYKLLTSQGFYTEKEEEEDMDYILMYKFIENAVNINDLEYLSAIIATIEELSFRLDYNTFDLYRRIHEKIASFGAEKLVDWVFNKYQATNELMDCELIQFAFLHENLVFLEKIKESRVTYRVKLVEVLKLLFKDSNNFHLVELYTAVVGGFSLTQDD